MGSASPSSWTVFRPITRSLPLQDTTNTGKRTKPMSMSRMGLKHTIFVLGRQKISHCFVSLFAPSYNCFQEAYSITFQKNFYKTAQLTFCRYLMVGWTAQWHKRKKVWCQYWLNCHLPGVSAENWGPAILFNLGFSTLNVTSEINRLLQQTDCKLCVITRIQRTSG